MEEGLRDIKPLLEIPDYSYFLFLGVVGFLILGLLTSLLFFIRKLLKIRNENLRKVYFKRLKSVNWNDTKKSAYEVTFLGRELATEPRMEEIYGQLIPMLEPYKYREVVPPVDELTLNQYNLLVHVVNESL